MASCTCGRTEYVLSALKLGNLPGWRWARIKQLALVGSRSSLHSGYFKALGGSDGVGPQQNFWQGHHRVRACGNMIQQPLRTCAHGIWVRETHTYAHRIEGIACYIQLQSQRPIILWPTLYGVWHTRRSTSNADFQHTRYQHAASGWAHMNTKLRASLRKGQKHCQWRLAEACSLLVEN